MALRLHRVALATALGLLATAGGRAQGTNAPLVVTTTAAEGEGSLQAALTAANAAAGPDLITFDIPGDGPYVVTPLNTLPSITGPVTLDGTTQPGYAGTPVVAVAADGLTLYGLVFEAGSDGSVLHGLAVHKGPTHFGGPLACVLVSNTADVTITSSYLGLATDGTASGCFEGLRVLGSSGTVVGGADPADRVVVSGNDGNGIWISGTATGPASTTLLQNVFVGTDPIGTEARANGSSGIRVGDVIANETTGTLILDAVVSGNGLMGVQVQDGAAGTRIADNRIGTTPDGTALLPNAWHGVGIEAADVEVEGNLISGNDGFGVSVDAIRATVRDNRIGTDVTGEIALPNFGGVFATGSDVTISGNTIAGNAGHGVTLSGAGATGAVLTGNRIGVVASGETLLQNGGLQILIHVGAGDNQIGGTEPGEGNTLGVPATCAPPGGGPPGDGPCPALVLSESAGIGNAIRTPPGEPFVVGATEEAIQTAIDLNDDGPTPNDPGDADDGPNNRQNTPDLLNSEFTESLLSGAYTTNSAVPIVTGLYLLKLLTERRASPVYQLVAVGEDTYTEADRTGCGSPPCPKAFSLTLPVPAEAGDRLYATATAADGSTSELSAPVVVTGDPTAADGAPPSDAVALLSAAPNPFRASTTVRYVLPTPTRVRLAVYDVLGREVAVLAEGERPAGSYAVSLDGAALAPGVYHYRLVAGRTEVSGRLVRAR